MASVNDSSGGTFNGKVGGLVYYQVGGKTYVRQAPPKQTKAKKEKTSELKMLYQSKMTLTQRHLKSLKGAIAFGFQNEAVGARRPFHACVSYTLNNSFIADGKYFALDPSLLKISRGNLLPPQNPKAEKTNDGILVTWDNNSYVSNSKPWDKAFIVLHNPENMISELVIFGNDRSSESEIFPLSVNRLKDKWHVYLAFSQEQTKSAEMLLSDSAYLGCL
ncbi:DUF6266 family protein [Cognataquiflexum aquatile]|uniref:DUF6266 family protein n=1 Tax=Cognataquiflexum aquatile TaxID=2249427 RepID=UPI000DEA3992|nr:DUF6266 family protein [Cognataquiflexum aquatile]